jgi:hypothetical protein
MRRGRARTRRRRTHASSTCRLDLPPLRASLNRLETMGSFLVVVVLLALVAFPIVVLSEHSAGPTRDAFLWGVAVGAVPTWIAVRISSPLRTGSDDGGAPTR